MKQFFATVATLIINLGPDTVINTCNSIQSGILLMVLKSEGDKIKYVVSPQRDRRYTIIAFSKFLADNLSQIPEETVLVVVKSLIELCASV